MSLRLLTHFSVGIFLLATACHQLPGQKSARRGEYSKMQRELQGALLSSSDVRTLAREVVSTEVRAAKGPKDHAFIRGLGACDTEIKSSLKQRSKTHDGVGAEAALLLLEADLSSNFGAKYGADPDGGWRAVAARGTVANRDARQAYFTDPDERVRQAALAASFDAKDEADTAALLEVSRLDPNPLSRSHAFRTLATMGGERITLALKDRYLSADEETRLQLVDAFGQPRVYSTGGQRELLRLLTHEHGYDALLAAKILAENPDVTLKNQGMTRLVRFLEAGTPEERRMAARMLPLNSKLTTYHLLQQSKTEDRAVALIALSRLLADPQHGPQAQAELLGIAKSVSALAEQARAALSASGDETLIPMFVEQTRAQDPLSRRLAAYGLLRLGALPEVALLLADDDLSLRRDVACRTLARAPLPVGHAP